MASDEDGTVAVILAVTALVLIVLVGFAIDMARLKGEQQKLQQNLDIAVLAAANEMSSYLDLDEVDVKSVAKDYYTANLSAGYGKMLFSDGSYDEGTNLIEVTGRVEVEPTFMGLLGFDTLSADVSAVSGPISRPVDVDVVLVMDNTDSIGYSDLNTIVSTSSNLVDYVFDNKGSANVHVGVVPFSRFVNIGDTNNNLPWVSYAAAYNPDSQPFEGCIHPYFDDRDLTQIPRPSEPVFAAYDYAKYPSSATAPNSARNHPLWWKFRYDTVSCRISPLTVPTDRRNTVLQGIDGMRGNIGGPTYLPSGLA